MTDLEIIKLLEKEINVTLVETELNYEGFDKFSKRNSYTINAVENVIGLDISRNELKKIPLNLLKLKKLIRLNLGENSIERIDSLFKLKNLEYFIYNYNHFVLSVASLVKIISNLKKLKRFEGFGSNWFSIIPKEALNHNLLLSDMYKAEDYTNSFNITGYDIYPPFAMIQLGYRNPKFYYNNYPDYLPRINKSSQKIDNEIKTKIIENLISKFYADYAKINEMPYAIRKISIYNYHGIKELLIDNIAINKETKEINDPHWIFITGKNGYGKTSLLQAITIGLFGNEDGKIRLSTDADIFLEFNNNQNYHINSVVRVSEFYSKNTIPFQNFAAYGPARLNKNPRPHEDSKTKSLFNSYGELLDIEERLIAWENDRKQKEYFKSAKEILLELLKPQIIDIIIVRDGSDTSVKYIEFSDKKTKKVFEELASGYRSIISMVGDIIIRLSKHQKKVFNFRSLAGIVLIDEIDLHLHPEWQKIMVEKLTELFPKIQFIASTHSPIPLLGAPQNSIILNVQRSEKKGIIAKKIDIDFTRLKPNSILSSPIFDFDKLISKSKPKNKFAYAEDDFAEISEKVKIQNDIEEFLSPQRANELLNLLTSESDEKN